MGGVVVVVAVAVAVVVGWLYPIKLAQKSWPLVLR
jgi:hypothetical protein